MRRKGLPTDWLRGIQDEQKRQEAEAIIRNSTTALSRFYDLIEEKEHNVNKNELTLSDFETPGWELKAAYRTGYRAALKELKSLLAFIKEKD